jgi:hypothetical protein
MKHILLAGLMLSIAGVGCASGQPKMDLSGAPRCLEYSPQWEGKGKPRDLEILGKMDETQLRDFLKDYGAEP